MITTGANTMDKNIGSLTLNFIEGRSAKIGDDITITVIKLKGTRQVKIKIECPKNIKIIRDNIKTEVDNINATTET